MRSSLWSSPSFVTIRKPPLDQSNRATIKADILLFPLRLSIATLNYNPRCVLFSSFLFLSSVGCSRNNLDRLLRPLTAQCIKRSMSNRPDSANKRFVFHFGSSFPAGLINLSCISPPHLLKFLHFWFYVSPQLVAAFRICTPAIYYCQLWGAIANDARACN